MDSLNNLSRYIFNITNRLELIVVTFNFIIFIDRDRFGADSITIKVAIIAIKFIVAKQRFVKELIRMIMHLNLIFSFLV